MFHRYIALGDSISIDRYPALDLSDRGQDYPHSGAVSLFYQNEDGLWPEFEGRDLRTAFPDLEFDRHTDDLTADGATLPDVERIQLKRLSRSGERTLITLTIGGNDLLSVLGSATAGPDLASRLLQRLSIVLDGIRAARPAATILLGTVYDPSDGTQTLYGQHLPREARWLDEYNGGIREMCDGAADLKLADIHRHFMGHGLSVAAEDRWYWSRSIIEPSAVGASEVRRLWLEAIGL